MKPAAFVAAAVLAALSCSSVQAGDWEAFSPEATSFKPGKHIMVARVGKKDTGEPLGSALVSAYESKLRERGYQGAEANVAATHSAVWPTFKDIDDVKDWLKDGHKVRTRSGSEGKVGGVAALANLASAAIKASVAVEGVLAVEAREIGKGAKKKLMAGLGKKFGVGGGESNDSAVFETRVTLFTEQGEVVWSAVEKVDKEILSERAQKHADAKMDEMNSMMEGTQKEMQAQMAGERKSKGDTEMAKALAGMSPEQRAMVEASMKGGQAHAAPGAGQSGMMKGIMKGMQTKPQLGPPEEWGGPAAEVAWEQLAKQFPKRK